jgi:HD-GYP domain-containing protein (c-di-GMP phosphodiesterase class II)
MKTHSLQGVKGLVKAGIKDNDILQITGNHHSRYLSFNKQYGQGVLALICNIIDIYDACRSIRCYKEAFTYGETLHILTMEKKENNWDGYVFNILLKQTLEKFEQALMD